MNAPKNLFKILFIFVVMGLMFPSSNVQAETAPDIIHSYEVEVTPQSDGTLIMRYSFDYEAVTDFPNNGAYLEFGVPNRKFEIMESGGSSDFISRVSAKTDGGSWVRFDFTHLPKAGERFQLTFTIHQKGMAHTKDEDVTFQFIPGWFDFAEIRRLTVKWHLPEDPAMIKLVKPETTLDGNMAIWTVENLPPSDKGQVDLQVMVAKTAFPGWNENEAVDNSGRDLLLICFWVVVAILVIILVLLIIGWLSDGGGYSGGSYVGRRGFFEYATDTVSEVLSAVSDSGGSFGGRGGSCACASSCACACACAGGGRAGCSRKGFDLTRFFLTIRNQLAKGKGGKNP